MSTESGTRDYGRFDELAEEFAERYRRGERPSLQEYIDRLPEMAEEIREMFPALVEVEQVEGDARDDARQQQPPAVSCLRQIGDYRILREVGRGGMGVVYEAEQISLGRRVALKVLPGQAAGDRVVQERFRREARATAKLHHTNIVPVYEIGQDGDVRFYAMQFIDGQGLDDVITELRRLLDRARSSSGIKAATGGQSRWPWGEHDRPGIDTPTLGEGVEVGAVLRSILTGRFDPGDRGPDPAGASPSMRASDTAGGLAAPTGTLTDSRVAGSDRALTRTVPGSATAEDATDPGPAYPPEPALLPSASPLTTSAMLPGGTQLSSVESGRRAFFRSLAQIGRQVAGGLAYAHARGIIHRDIKPSNLLLDTEGVVWIADFGLAKGDDEGLTQSGDILGTLRYMAPERFRGEGDARADVYALGLTLYELLTLRPGFESSDRLRLIEQIKTEEPPRPRMIDARIPRDLETIVLKAIEKDPRARYQSAEAMGEDLGRFLADEPIKARQVSAAERYWRWARRNPVIATLGGVLTVLLVAATVVSLIVAGNMARLAKNAQDAARAEMWSRKEADLARDAARHNEREAITARDVAKHAQSASSRQAAGLLFDRGIEDARGGEPARALHLFVQALQVLPADDPQAAPLERMIRANLSAWAETVPAQEHIWPGWTLFANIAFTPDGEWIAMAVREDEIQCSRTDTGRPVGPPIKIPDGVGETMEFAPDGRSLWVASPYRRKQGADKWAIHRLDGVSGHPVQPPISTTGPVQHLIVTPDGRYLVGAVLGIHQNDPGPGGGLLSDTRWRTASIMVWDTASGQVVRMVDVNGEEHSSFMGLSPGGKSVTAWVLRASNMFEGMTFTVDETEPPISLGLHPMGRRPHSVHHFHKTLNFQHNMRTALVIKDGDVHRWSATDPGVLGPGVPTPFHHMHDGHSADGRSVISPIEGRVFDIGAWPPRPSGVRFVHPGWQQTLNAFKEESGDGRFTATSILSDGGGVRLWRLPRPHSRPPLPPTEFVRLSERTDYYNSAQFDPRGSSAILWGSQAGHDTDGVLLVDVATGAVRRTSIRHSGNVLDVVFTPNGRHFATASNDATARVWETATGRPAGPPLTHRNYVATVAFSPDGNTLAAGDYGPNGLIKLWDWRTGREVRPPLEHDDIVLHVSFSPDGRHVAALKAFDWSNKPEILVWEIASGTAVIRVPHHYSLQIRDVNNIAFGSKAQFRPDGRAVAARDENGVLRLWEVPSGKRLGERPLDGAGLIRFSPDGRIVAAAANLGVRLLDAGTLAPLPGGYLPHPDPIQDLAFSPDGGFLLTGHESGSAQLWDVATRKPVGPPAVLIGPIRAVTFTPDGKTCVCVAADGTLRRWSVPEPFAEPDLARLVDRVALMTGQRMDDSQGLDSLPAGEWRALRAKLMGDRSTALISPRPDADWHDAVAAAAEQDRDVFGAEWHLDRLAALRPHDWTIPARRGRLLARAGRHEEAASSYVAARSLSSSPRDLVDWLRAAAAEDEATMRYDAGLWNMDRAVEITPDDWTLYATRAALADLAGHPDRSAADLDEAIRRGAEASVIARAADHAARAGDWKRAAAFLTGIARDPASSTGTRFRQIFALLKVGDNAGYRAACAEFAGRVPPVGPGLSGSQANNAAWAFAVGPKATDDWTRPLGWLDHALIRLTAAEKANPTAKDQIRQTRHVFLNTRGAVLYRAGRFEEAARTFRECIALDPRAAVFQDWLFLALAQHRLGHADDAKGAAVKARAARPAATAGSVWDRVEVELLAAELDAAIPLPGQ